MFFVFLKHFLRLKPSLFWLLCSVLGLQTASNFLLKTKSCKHKSLSMRCSVFLRKSARLKYPKRLSKKNTETCFGSFRNDDKRISHIKWVTAKLWIFLSEESDENDISKTWFQIYFPASLLTADHQCWTMHRLGHVFHKELKCSGASSHWQRKLVIKF